MIYNPYDYYFNKAKKEWYKARSAFKLEEIQHKYKILDKYTKSVLDIGCAPWSWMQHTSGLLSSMNVKDFHIVWFDIQESTVNLPNVHSYIQDITDKEKVEEILKDNGIKPYCDSESAWPVSKWNEEFITNNMNSSLCSEWQGGVDFIQSDMAPNTVWHKSIDAIRSIWLLEETLRIYKNYLKPNWKFVIKIFMWPGFEEFLAELKSSFWSKNIKIFKPKASRSTSKETYIIKI